MNRLFCCGTQSELTELEKALISRRSAAKSRCGERTVTEISVEFLNHMLVSLWPHITKYILDLVSTELEPAVQGALGEGFKFEKKGWHLGTAPLKARSGEFYCFQEPTTEGKMPNLTLEVGFDWVVNDLNIQATFMGAKIGLSKLTFSGELLLELVDVLLRPPTIRGFRFSFLGAPKVELQFCGGKISKVLNLKLIQNSLVDCIYASLSDFTFPKRFAYVVDEEGDTFDILHPTPRGYLDLKVLRAANLLAHDWLGTSDPYLVVRSGPFIFKSKVKNRTLSPTFDLEVRIPLHGHDQSKQEILLSIYDRDRLSMDDLMGQAILRTRELEGASGAIVECPLEDNKGRLYLSAVHKQLIWGWIGSRICSGYVVLVGLYFAEHVPRGEKQHTYYVKAFPKDRPDDEQSTLKVDAASLHAAHDDDDDAASVGGSSMGVTTRTSAQSMSMRKKFMVCKKSGMSLEEIAFVLNVDLEEVEDLDTGIISSFFHKKTEHVRVPFDHMFEFFTELPEKDTITMELWTEHEGEKSKLKKWVRSLTKGHQECLGRYSFKVSDLMVADAPGKPIMANLESGVILKLRLQLHSLNLKV